MIDIALTETVKYRGTWEVNTSFFDQPFMLANSTTDHTGEGEASDWDLAERGRSPGAMTGGASSMDALTHFSQQQPFAVARSISPNINCRQTMVSSRPQ